jgi:N-methylhydantoinase A/oxoprolinase/acetone carboxylase beta subunit
MGATVTEALRSDFGQVEVLLEQQLEMRYKGQRHSVKVPVYSGDQMEGIRERFLSIYLERYGLEDPVCPIEMIGIRVIGRAISDALDLSKLHSAPVSGKSSPIAHREVHFEELGSRTRTPIFLRKDLPIGFAQKGPAVIEEFSSTTLVGPRDQFSIGQLGEIQIEVG